MKTKTVHKYALKLAAVLALLCALLCFALSSEAGNVSNDPADSYVKETAEYEDSTLSLWFEHSFKKVFTSDTAPSGMDTYSVYMAKNEVESAQFVLYSDSDKTGMKAEVSSFTNEAGDTMSAEIYYEMYVTTSDLYTTSVIGSTEETSFIREGETPDPVVPLKKVKTFKLNGGKSQAFFIKIKSTADTPAGWYSARLNIMNSDGQVVKTATVFAYVWDFALSNSTEFQTSLYLDNNTSYQGTYKAFYDYLLENRMCAMDIPGALNSSNPYLTDERVNSVRVTISGGGTTRTYMDKAVELYPQYLSIYNELSTSDIWDSVKDKLYFYTVDEPMSKEQQDAIGSDGATIDDAKNTASVLNLYWPDARIVIPFHENHPYPYYTYHQNISDIASYNKKDAVQEMIDSSCVTVWCPQNYAFTPSEELRELGYAGLSTDKLRNLSCTISGLYALGTPGADGKYYGAYAGGYYDWESLYGDFKDRVLSSNMIANESGEKQELWAYKAGFSGGYSYCHHLIESTGLQTKMMFWQFYQNDVTGYLYYAVNDWLGEADTTVTGALNQLSWMPNSHTYPNGKTIYGIGTLFYGASQAKIMGTSYIGSLRVEIMRDGIEEYQMLTMLEDLKGKDAAKAVVSKVSKNVVNYLSMPAFSTSAWSSDMDEYDIMASVRKELGNAVEAATLAGQCEHNWNSGTVVTAAGCITTGEKKFTCTLCGAERTDIIPTLHSTGSTFTVVSGNAATCTTDSTEILRCSVCGYEKASTVKAFHSDSSHYKYEQYNEFSHKIVCDTCSKQVELQAHVMLTKYTNTCTEAGEKQSVCRFCGYTVVIEEVEAKGHNYVDGVCTSCGAKEAGTVYTLTVDGVTAEYSAGDTVTLKAEYYTDGQNGYRFAYWSGDTDVLANTSAAEITFTMPEKDVTLTKNYVTVGDANGDGRVNGTDTNYMKRTLTGSLTETSAMDINLDGRVNGTDANLLKRILVGSYVPEK